jgi:hypothetical protein
MYVESLCLNFFGLFSFSPLKNKISLKIINQIYTYQQGSLIHTNKSFQNDDKENQDEIKNILELHQSSKNATSRQSLILAEKDRELISSEQAEKHVKI